MYAAIMATVRRDATRQAARNAAKNNGPPKVASNQPAPRSYNTNPKSSVAVMSRAERKAEWEKFPIDVSKSAM
jgi:pyruvate/2-oxoacid:ferredoxin oxidoreductase beta subunit